MFFSMQNNIHWKLSTGISWCYLIRHSEGLDMNVSGDRPTHAWQDKKRKGFKTALNIIVVTLLVKTLWLKILESYKNTSDFMSQVKSSCYRMNERGTFPLERAAVRNIQSSVYWSVVLYLAVLHRTWDGYKRIRRLLSHYLDLKSNSQYGLICDLVPL